MWKYTFKNEGVTVSWKAINDRSPDENLAYARELAEANKWKLRSVTEV